MPNVRIEDMGHKMGTNGVDNGKLWFDGKPTVLSAYRVGRQLTCVYACLSRQFLCRAGTRVPRGALLNASSTVDRDGTFHSPVAKPRDRFLKVLLVFPELLPCNRIG